jgi:hypothetical protein
LIGVAVLPLPKITDMALSADVCRPAYCTVHDCLINLDREQHNPVLFALLLKGRFDFLLNPAALDRMFGQDKEQSVIYLNRFIDSGPKFVPDFQVLRRKPATYPSVL